jgi:hypothetical protein
MGSEDLLISIVELRDCGMIQREGITLNLIGLGVRLLMRLSFLLHRVERMSACCGSRDGKFGDLVTGRRGKVIPVLEVNYVHIMYIGPCSEVCERLLY